MRPKHYQYPVPEISEYVENLLDFQSEKDLNTVLVRAQEHGTPPLQITQFDTRHLEVLARLAQPTKILEIGTLCGYSTVALARALKKDGVLYTCEKSSHHANTARKIFKELNLNETIRLIEGDIFDHLDMLSKHAPFDVIFIDSKKEDYPNLFDWCVTHLKTGGVLMADNVFALGHIHRLKLHETATDKLSSIVNSMHKFNTLCATDPRLRTTILPTGEGLLVAIKI